MALQYVWIGAAVLVASILIFILRRQKKPVLQKVLSFDSSSSVTQRTKKRKHFGFGKNKKKNGVEGEGDAHSERRAKEPQEKKGKKKGKNKVKAVGGKNVVKAVESQPELESDKESGDGDEQNEQELDEIETPEEFSSEEQEKLVVPAKSEVTRASPEKMQSSKTLAGKTTDIETETAAKKGKKKKLRKEDDEAEKMEELTVENEKVVDDRTKVVIENHENSEERDVLEPVGPSDAKRKKKKKNKNKTAGSNDVPPSHDGATLEDLGAKNTVLTSNTSSNEMAELEANLELEDRNGDDGFLPVTKEKVQEVVKTPVLKAAAAETDDVKLLTESLNAEKTKMKALSDELKSEQENNQRFKHLIEQMAHQVQDKDGKIVQYERIAEQQAMELKNLRAQQQDSSLVLQKIRDENKSLKDAIPKAQQLAELQQKVRVMDDALKQNAVQLNASEKARKDLELKDKRQLEKVLILEAKQTELADLVKTSDQRCQSMSSEIQHLTLERAQIEKMTFLEAEKQKAELERLLKTLETRNNELLSYGRLRDEEIQRLQAEISLMNETFQRRSREFEARVTDRDALAAQAQSLRQQLNQDQSHLEVLQQKEAELQGLRQKEAEFAQKEAELQTLRLREAEFVQIEAEFIQKEAELQRLCQIEAESVQKQAELQRKNEEFAQKEAEFMRLQEKGEELAQMEVELRRLQQKEEEFLQMEVGVQELNEKVASLMRREAELQNSGAGLDKLQELEKELESSRTELSHLHQKEADLIGELGQLKMEFNTVQEENKAFGEARSKLASDIGQLDCDIKAKDQQIAQLEHGNQELTCRVFELQTSLAERDRSAENFTQMQGDLNQRLEHALLMQHELEAEKRENTMLRDKIEQMKSELLHHLTDSDTQLRQALEEKDKEIEELKRMVTSATKNEESLRNDDMQQVQVDGQHIETGHQTLLDANRQ